MIVVVTSLIGIQVDDVVRGGGRARVRGRAAARAAGTSPSAGAAHHDLPGALLLQRHGHGVAAAQPARVELRAHLLSDQISFILATLIYHK